VHIRCLRLVARCSLNITFRFGYCNWFGSSNIQHVRTSPCRKSVDNFSSDSSDSLSDCSSLLSVVASANTRTSLLHARSCTLCWPEASLSLPLRCAVIRKSTRCSLVCGRVSCSSGKEQRVSPPSFAQRKKTPLTFASWWRVCGCVLCVWVCGCVGGWVGAAVVSPGRPDWNWN
jgi:hypothetical protein